MAAVTEQQAVKAATELNRGLSKSNIAAPNPLTQPSTGLVGRALSTASSGFGFFATWLYMPFIPNTIATIIDQPGKIPYVGKPFKMLASALRKPADVLNNDTLNSFTGSVEKSAAKVTGSLATRTGSEKLSTTAGFMGENKGSRAAFKTSKSILTTMGNWIEQRVSKISFLDNFRNRSVKGLDTKASTAFNEAQNSLNKALGELKGNEFSEARPILEAAQKQLSLGMRKANPALIKETTSKIETALKAVENTQGVSDATKAALKAANTHIATFAKNTLSTHRYFNAAALRRDFGVGLSKIPARLSKMSMSDGLSNGIYYSGQAMTVYSTAQLFTGGMGTLKHMYQSITGTKPSTFTMLFGKMPEAMKDARSQYWFSSLPQAGANFVGMAVWRMMMKGGGGAKSVAVGIGAQMAAGSVGSFFADQKNLFSAYRKLAMEQAQGEPIPAGGYIGLLVYASPEARKLSAKNPEILEAIAQQYANERIPVGLVMREVEKGGLSARITTVKANPPQVKQEGAMEAEIGGKAERPPVQLGTATIASKATAGSYADTVKASQGIMATR